MTEPDSIPVPPRPPAWTTRKVVTVLALGALVTGGAGLYLARLSLARDVLSGWLEARGVDSDLKFDTFGLGGLSGKLRVGPASRPVLTAEKLEVGYGFGGFWSGEPLGLQIRSVRLVRPILRGALKNGALTLGPLDPIIAEFRRRPPRPDLRQPAVHIEDGLLVLQSTYGILEVQADAELDDGKLLRLDARSSPARLEAGDADFAALGPGGLTVRTKDDQVDILFQVYVAELQAGDTAARALNVRLAAQGPYPDLQARRGAGPVALRLILAGASLSHDGNALADARLESRFDGRSAGWIDDLALKGTGEVELAAARAHGAGAGAEKVRLKLEVPQVDWTRKGGDRLAGRYVVALLADRARQASLDLRGPKAQFQGTGLLGPAGADLQMTGQVSSKGGWNGLGRPLAADDPQTAALKRALGDFDLSAPALAVNYERGQGQVALVQPATIRTRSGGAASLSAIGGAPVYDAGKGAFALAVSGGGLPTADLAVDRYAVSKGAIAATARLKAQGGFGPVREGSIVTGGALRIEGGGLSYTAHDCASLSVKQLDLGENDVEALSGRLCPTRAPLLTVADGAMRLRGQAKDVDAGVAFLQARVEDAAGAVDMTFGGKAPHGQARIESARLEDAAPQTRFNPAQVSGVARLDGQVWEADLDFSDLQGRHLADAVLHHDGASGAGELDFDTLELRFDEAGLQPADLTPLLAPVASPVVGEARFSGEIAWAKGEATSQGVLKVGKLDFRSPAGAVTGLSGEVAFTSLTPPTAAPGQTLSAQRIDLMGPLTDAKLVFGLDAGGLKVQSAAAQVGGGAVKLEPFTLPLTPGAAWSGALDIEGVQVADIVKASPFGDRMALNAKLSGRLPFSMSPEGVRIAGGELHAIEPGTLSIAREALSGMEAQTGVAVEVPGVPAAKPPADNLVADFAYQALEHLSYEKLAAEVDSRAEGRLGVMFWIKGEFTPPQRQEIRLGYLEAIRGDYMEKKLPLPSNTKVDLALDTSVNLDQLLDDYAEYQRLRGSRPVQP